MFKMFGDFSLSLSQIEQPQGFESIILKKSEKWRNIMVRNEAQDGEQSWA